jgi:orotate phosphoribosyltransferase-like protein
MSEVRFPVRILSPARLEEISKTLRDLSNIVEKSKGKKMVVGLKPNGVPKRRPKAVLYK